MALQNDPDLPDECVLPCLFGEVSIANIKYSVASAADANFNLIRNNAKLTQEQTAVKY